MLLIIGSTGTLGQALMREAKSRNIFALGAARHGTDCNIDLMNKSYVLPDAKIIINCAALTDIDYCEREPAIAYMINTRPAGLFAQHGARYVHISTDQTQLVNEYARSKYAGEQLALTAKNPLIIRTNFTGWRGWSYPRTFIEWATTELLNKVKITGFIDYFNSTIDADTLAKAVLDLLLSDAKGLFNIGASEVFNKYDFLRQLATELCLSTENIVKGSIESLSVPRAKNSGLNVSVTEEYLGYHLPTMKQVAFNLINTRPRWGYL